MTVVDGPPQNLEMDLAFLEGLDLPDLQQIGPPEASGLPSTSSDQQHKPAQPTKGQRYRQNRKTLTSNLEARLQELRRAIESKELERQELLLKSKYLEAGLQAAAGAAQAKSASEPEAQGERWNLGSFKACKAHMQEVSERPLDRDARVRLSNQARLADRAAILTLNFYGAEARQITVDELAHLPVRECLEIWRACVGVLTELLLEANGDADSEAGRRVSEVLTDWELVVGARRRYNMNGLREMFSQPPHAVDPDCNLEEMQPVDYHQVSSAMGVSEEQTKQLLATRRDYLSSVRELLTDRQAIFRQLQEMQRPLCGGESKEMIHQAKLHQELLKKLKQNLDQDLVLYLGLMDCCFKKVLTRFQKVYLVVLTWPRSCDVMELLNHLASLAGETSTKELLGPVLHGAKTMAVQAHNGHAPAATAA